MQLTECEKDPLAIARGSENDTASDHAFRTVRDSKRTVLRLPQFFAIALLRFYKLAVSPWLAPACRFHPSCSDYMREAVEKHGALRGFLMGARRFGKCHPFHEGGFDPVP